MKIREILTEVDRLKDEIDALRPIDTELEARILQKLRLEWNYHSNAIEGNTLTFGETKALIMNGITAGGKPLKDHQDIRGHKEVIDVLSEIVRKQEELTEVVIRELHKILLVEPYQLEAIDQDGIHTTRRIEIGQYKSSPNHVKTQTGEIHYFATPEETPAKMADLISWYRKERDGKAMHPVILAAMFHYKFVAIHPFDDGNGRMARILMNLILMQFGYPPAVFKIEEKGQYFAALSKADAGEVEDFISLVANRVIETENLYLRAARGEEIEDLSDIDKKLALLRQAVESEASAEKDEVSQETQQYIVNGFVSTLFTVLGSRLEQLDSLFTRKSMKINVAYQGGGYNHIQGDILKRVIDSLKQLVEERKFASVFFNYSLDGLKHDLGKSFFCSIEMYFNPKDIVIIFQATEISQHELCRIKYSYFPDEAEGARIAKVALEKMIIGFEELIGKSI